VTGRSLKGADAEERQALCTALVALVLDRGYAEVDVDAVCRQAGVAPEAFRRHFTSLEECFASAWQDLEDAYLTRVESAYGQEQDWRDRFRAGALETFRLAEAHPVAARFLAVAALSAGELGRARQRALGSRIAALVDTVRDELGEPEAVPAITSRWIVSIFFDRIYRHFASADGPDLISQLPELMFLSVSVYFGTEAGLAELKRMP
jgi:AcrR family transcriptional regulator